ncbi:WhiB family transcriptional regulator [Streptomyces sp. NPDC046977]|uniref:WhiB family transcriptional regulator n=1 Tax=Streptomyces sp. NPDC046977 TaxID=3154703 RepID=UPI0033D41A72
MDAYRSREDAAKCMAEGLTDHAIGLRLRMDPKTVKKWRAQMGVPQPQKSERPAGASVQEALDFHAVHEDAGHIGWSGTVRNGHPIVKLRGQWLLASRVAFELGHGRQPVGNVKASCGRPRCLESTHLTDRRMRDDARAKVREAAGRRPPPATCAQGHNQRVFGHLKPDGVQCCTRCRDAPRPRNTEKPRAMDGTAEWTTRAACQGSTAALWETPGVTSPEQEQAHAARSVCNTLCAVRAECLEHAMTAERGSERTERTGIRGGLDGGERHDLETGRAMPEEHGTALGFRRHQLLGEPRCPRCLNAQALAPS